MSESMSLISHILESSKVTFEKEMKKQIKDFKNALKGTEYTINKKGQPCLKRNGENIPLANFIPMPKEKRVIDDGTNIYSEISMSCLLNGEEVLNECCVSYMDMQKQTWIDASWNFKCSLYPSAPKAYDHLIIIIKHLSSKLKEQHIFAYIGWTKIDGNYCYLHKGGAIGDCDIKVKLDKSLSHFNMTCYKDNYEKGIFIRMLDLLRVANKEVTIPLFSYLTLSVINYFLKEAGIEAKFTMWLHGESGSRKTTIAKLFTNFFNFDSIIPICSFKDTKAAIERLTFEYKDSILLLDDFHPSTSKSEKDDMTEKAQHFVRIYGDRETKKRMTSKLEKQKEFPPRGLMLITGEDFIGGVSSTARCFSVPIKKSDVDLFNLSRAQRTNYAVPTGMYFYIEYLTKRMKSAKKELKTKFIEYRDKFSKENLHGRSPENIAWLLLSYEFFLEYGQSIGNMKDERKKKMLTEAENILVRMTESQFSENQSEDPVTMYLTSIKELLISKQVSIATIGNSSRGQNSIGWEDKDFFYLLPEITFNQVNAFWRKQNKLFPVSSRKLNETLQSKGIIEVEEEKNNDTKTYKRTLKRTVCENNRIRVLVINKAKMDKYLQN